VSSGRICLSMEEEGGWYGLGVFYRISSCSMTNAITGFDNEYGSLSTAYDELANIDYLFGVTVL